MEPLRVKAVLSAALFSGFALFGAVSAGAQSNASAARRVIAKRERPRVYLFRGFAGMAFARGVDTLAEMIRRAGLSATVNEAIACPLIAQEAVRDYRANPGPIVVIGHSIGAACAIAFAEMLNVDASPDVLFGTMNGYSGQYRLRGADTFVTKVDTSWHPAWVGSEQVRHFKLEGDTLSVMTPPQDYPKFPGQRVRGIAVWEREPRFEDSSRVEPSIRG
jgi:fermentation-respiration switch protein FrsA (DUF1100 family)